MSTRLSLVQGGATTSAILPDVSASLVVERVTDKVRMLAAVKPALVRLLEWQIDAALDRAETERHGQA